METTQTTFFKPSERLVTALKASARVTGIFAIAVGLAVLAGWALGMEALKAVAPRLTVVNPTTAATFVLTGAALCFLESGERRSPNRKQRRIGMLLAWMVFLIGGLKFFSVAFGLHFELLRNLFEAKSTTTGALSEMEFNTALNFVLIGASLLTLDLETRNGFRPAQIFAVTAELVALLAIVNYSYRSLESAHSTAFVPMGLNTAITFLLLSFGCLAARPKRGLMKLIASESTGGTIARRLLPASILIPIILGGLRLLGEQSGIFGTEFAISLFAVLNAVIVAGLIWWTASLLYRGDEQRKKSEAALAQSEQQFRHVWEDSLDGMRLKDENGNMLLVNSAFCKLVGMSAEELIGKPFTIIYAAELRDDLMAKYRKRMKSRVIEAHMERETHFWNGKKFWLELSNTLLDIKGESPQLLSIFRDVTERKRSELALEHERYLLRSLMDNVPDRIYFKDLQSRFLRSNRAQAKRFGLDDPEQTVGKTDFDFFDKEHARRAYEDEQQVIRSGKTLNKEEKLSMPDGNVSWSMTTKLPLKDEHGQTIGTFGISRDITDRKLAEEKLKLTSDELRTKNAQMQSDFDMAREIQNIFLPSHYPTFPRSATAEQSAIKFCHRYEPAAAVGGDFFDVFPINDTTAGIFICDVLGHGMRAALITAIIRSLVEELMPVAADTGKFLEEINRSLHAILGRTEDKLLVTAFYLVVDSATHEIRFSNAGHPSPFHLKRNAGVVEPLSAADPRHGPALGLLESPMYPVCSCPVAANDLLLLYTDGLFEQPDANGEEFGKERILAAVRNHVQTPMTQLCDELLDEVKQFSQRKDFEDDVCLVGVEIAH